MITRPLELVSRLSPLPRDLDFMAWVNVGVIAVFFGLIGSRFILSPGLPVGVNGQNIIELPAIGLNPGAGSTASVVVSYRRDNVILFEGGMYTLPDLRLQMETYAKAHRGAVMLVRADRQVSVQAFVELCEMARSVGFAQVLMATETATDLPK